MKREPHRFDDENIKKQLKQMPTIEDHQTKDELYRKISPHVSKPASKKKRTWFAPAVATCAVLLLLALILPTVMLNSNQGSAPLNDSADQAESSGEKANESSEETTSEDAQPEGAEESESQQENPSHDSLKKEPDASSQAEDGGEASFSEDAGPQLNSHVVTSSEEGAVQVAFPEPSGQYVVPVTLQSDSDAQKSLIDILNEGVEEYVQPETLGLLEFMLEGFTFSVDESGKTARITAPEGFSSQGSSADVLFVDSVQSMFSSTVVEEVALKDNQGNPLVLGNYGELTSLTVEKEERAAYKIFQANNETPQLLIPIKADYREVSEAIEELKESESQNKIYPSIPEQIAINDINAAEDSVTIQFNDAQDWEANQEILNMVESILMTVKAFGYEEVVFESPGRSQIGPYDLTGSISVPSNPNPID
ncbi:GerMN domain-containing protein [Thalassobacillus sp. CUG 92003]|uniref:GerMN domain-containing protein n=1 Tax=Thalassobacillus sp. CUG 92003 TaxID=2736641 RepID=UPI0015E77000|nr:GerMN domain-containing protein [Thalassobacillus sp. CUG 92003]